MPEHGFFLTCMFSHKDKIVDSVLIREIKGQRKLELQYILHSNVWMSRSNQQKCSIK